LHLQRRGTHRSRWSKESKMDKSPKRTGSSQKKPAPKRPGKRLIFRRYRTTKSGKVLDAQKYGLEAWPMWV
jgi:hypothetical protein